MTMEKQPTFLVRLTASQRMALLDVIIHVMTGPMRLEVFVDVVRNVETRPEDLLQLVMNAPSTAAPSSAYDVPELYDVARQVCHEFGIPWTDPRTGITYPPP